MISKHKLSFEGISEKKWNSLSKNLRDDVSKYRRVRRDVIKFEKEIDKYKNQIQTKKDKIKEYNKILTHLYGKISYLKSDYFPIVNVVNYKKSDNVFWNINIKFKNYIKSIYLGSDKKIRKMLSEKIGMRKNVSKDKLKQKLEFYLIEEVEDLVIDNKNDYDNWNIKKEELWKYIV